MTAAMRTGKEKLIEQLVADGFTYMFGNPGTVEQGFLDAMGKYPALRYITCLHETVAVAMADGYARRSNAPALVQLHSGVGLGNGVGMLYQAFRGHAPLVVLAGEAGIRYDAMDAQMACDLVAVARPVVKWAGRVVHRDSLLRLVRRAVKMATTPPCGPVFLALPMDILDKPNREEVRPSVRVNADVSPPDSLVAEAAGILLGAREPAFVIGDGVSASGGRAALEEVVRLLAPQVWGADNSLVNMDRTLPSYQGDLGHMFGSSSREKLCGADVVLILGTTVLPEVFPDLDFPFRAGAKIIHVDCDAYEIAKNHHVDLAMAASPGRFLLRLADVLKKRSGPETREAAARRARALRAEQEKRASVPSGKDAATAFLSALRARLGDDVVIFDEALTASGAVHAFFPRSADGSLFQTRGGSLGVGIPGAMGIKLAAPEKTVLAFTGDGGSMYTIQALHTARRYNIGAKFVICNNGSYGLLEDNIRHYWKERQIPEHPFPDCFRLAPAIDFAALSISMGVDAARMSAPEDADRVVEKMLACDAPFLVDLSMPR